MEFKFVQIKCQVFFKGEIIKKCKNGMLSFRFFFSRTTGPILTRLGTNHPWRKRIQVPLKEGDSPLPKGDNSKIVKVHRQF
jgi:hypothetical protein